MSENNSVSDESYSDEDDEEELDPRIQDELEKLNAATNSINHLEAELDEARAVFRQTLAGATYQLNGVAHKLGKCVEKSRPFYEAYRQLRQSHSMLQRSTNQFERASGMHLAAKNRVGEAERRVFGGGAKRAFDSALQEMLNQATIEVNEAEKMKRDSWKKHQEDLLAYRDLEAKVKQLYKKLKSPVEKAKPYFEQKKDFDRHLWQLKLRVDSIHLGLSGAKENYSECLKSLEVISDDIHEKRKSKRMEAMIAKLQEREAGVGADSSTEDETSLTASNLDLDFDSNVNFDKLDRIGDSMSLQGNFDDRINRPVVGCEVDTNSSSSLPSVPLENRVVYGLESPEDTAGLGSAKTESEPGTSNLESKEPVSLEEPSQPESAARTEDEPTLSSENVASSNEQVTEKDAPSIQSATTDLSQEGERISALEDETTQEKNCDKFDETDKASSNEEITEKDAPSIQSASTDLSQEGERFSTLEDETTHEENCDKFNETTSDDFCVTIAVDEMHSSDTMTGEDSATATNEALTAQIEAENNKKDSILEESELLENQDKRENENEGYETQNEKANEIDTAKQEDDKDKGHEVLATNDDEAKCNSADEAGKGVKNVNGSSEATESVTEPEEKQETSCNSEKNEKAEQDKETTNDDEANTDSITEGKETSDLEIQENIDEKEVSKDNTDVENTTFKESDSEIKEKVGQDKDVTNNQA